MRDNILPRLSHLALSSLLLLLFLSTTVSALKQPTLYCKCICFQNSTIIPLNSPPQQPPSSPSSSSTALSHRTPADNTNTNTDNTNTTSRKHHTLTCNDCNRAFCLDYNLPICKNAKEEDVFATCFQRDSLKDRTIVILFLLATSSLLGWALIKPFVVKTTNSIRSSSENMGLGRYMPVRHAMTPSEDLGGNYNHSNRNNGAFGSDGVLDASNNGGGGGSAAGGRRARTGGGSLSRQGGLNS